MTGRFKNTVLILFLTLVFLTLINSTDICNSTTVFYRKNDYLKYRVTGSIWIKAEVFNTTIVDKTPRTSYINYYTHVIYTKYYTYTLREVAIVKYINKTYILLRGERVVSDIKLHYFNENVYASPPHILRESRINYVDFILFSNPSGMDLTIVNINDLYSSRSFELLIEYGLLNLSKVLSLENRYDIVDKLILKFSDGTLLIIDPKISTDYNMRSSKESSNESRGEYFDLEYDILLRYFNGVLTYGLINIYGNKSRTSIVETYSRKSEYRNTSKIYLSLEIELIDTSIEEIPTWRSLRVDLIYLFKSENALENSLLILIIVTIPVLSLYFVYKKLSRGFK